MPYLAYLYDKDGDLWRISEVDTLAAIHFEVKDSDDFINPPHRHFVMVEQGQTVYGVPRAIYQER